MRGSRVVDHAGDGILVEDYFKQHLDAMFGRDGSLRRASGRTCLGRYRSHSEFSFFTVIGYTILTSSLSQPN